MVDNSPQVANAKRQALELQNRRDSQPEHDIRQVAQPETTVRVSSREVRIATGAPRRKYSFLGIRFGPKEFPTANINLPVYKENDRGKRYFSAVKQKNVDSIQSGGFQTAFGGNSNGSVSTPRNVGQHNSRGHIYFFNSENNARVYGKTNIDGDYAIVEFVMPEDHEFTPDPEAGFNEEKLSKTQAMRTAQSIPANCIKSVKLYSRSKVEN